MHQNRRKLSAGLAAALALALVATALASQPNGRSTANNALGYGLFSVSSDGTALSQLQPALQVKELIAETFTWAPDRQQLLFSASGALYRIQRDGSGLTQLSATRSCAPFDGEVCEVEAAWTPDGSHVIWQSGAGPIEVSTPDGSQRRVLAPSSKASVPSNFDLSPDGNQLAFVRGKTEGFEGTAEGTIYTIRLDGTDLRQSSPTSKGRRNASPQWSPDGSRILFINSKSGESFEDAEGVLYTVRPDSSELVRLRSKQRSPRDYDPVWSPDGKKVAFVTGTNGPHENTLGIANANGSGSKSFRRACESSVASISGWSPDGKQLTFTCDHYDSGIFSIGASGANLRRLSKGIDRSLEWSPDGSRILFSRETFLGKFGDRSRQAIYVMAADGSGVRRITPFTAVNSDQDEEFDSYEGLRWLSPNEIAFYHSKTAY